MRGSVPYHLRKLDTWLIVLNTDNTLVFVKQLKDDLAAAHDFPVLLQHHPVAARCPCAATSMY